MKKIALVLAVLLCLAGDSSASDPRQAQQVWIYLGKVPREKGIHLLSPPAELLEKKGKRWCRRTGEGPLHKIAFDVADSFFEEVPPKVAISVEYFDGGKDTFATVARTLEGYHRVGRILEKKDSRTWKTYTAFLSYPQFGPREDRITQPDLFVNNRRDGNEYVRMLRVRIPYLHPETEKLGNLFGPQENVLLRVRCLKRGAAESFALRWEVRDWQEAVVRSGENTFVASPGFSVAQEVALTDLPFGAYCAVFILKRGETPIEEAVLHFGVAKPVVLKGDPQASPFGVCAEFLTPFAGKKARLLKESGLVWARQVIRGEKIYAGEKPDWKETDAAIQAARREGIHLLGTLLGAPHGAGNLKTDESRNAFARYAEEVARRYPAIRHWEIWNEPDTIGFWGDRDWKRYLALMKTVYPRLKKVNSSLTIMNGGLVAGNFWYLGELYQGGIKGFLDAVAIHPYAAEPETGKSNLARRIQNALGTLQKQDPARKLWITELGWTTSVPEGATLREQASILIKAVTVALSYPEVEKIFWFTFDDLGEDPEVAVQNAGLVRKDLSPKPSLIAYRHLVQRLSGKRCTGKEDLGKAISAYRFEGDKEIVRILWAQKPNQEILLAGKDAKQFFDMMGNAILPALPRLLLGPDPVFMLSSPDALQGDHQ
ncbi:MAG: glycosyl hydrolase [Candidatus Omnitrophota bacterium]